MNFIKELYAFLGELAVNNNRPWFMENKSRYDALRAQWEKDIDRLKALMTQWEPDFRKQPLKDCFYRIYRDIRFSNDKTPYKTYFSAAFSPYGRKTDLAAYYFQLGICETGVYGGIWCADSAMVKKLRKAIVDNDEEFAGIAHTLESAQCGARFVGEALKTAPKGFDPAHPLIKYLRFRQLGVEIPLTKEALEKSADWVELVNSMLRTLKPLNDFINYSLTEE